MKPQQVYIMMLKKLCALITNYDSKIYTIVDGISSMGAHYLNQSQSKIDCVIAGSQKGFGVPPGLAFVGLSQRALEIEGFRHRFYFDLKKEFIKQQSGLTQWTPCVSLIFNLQTSLSIWKDRGINQVINHHAFTAQCLRKALIGSGLTLFAQNSPANSLTSFCLPDKLQNQGKQIINHLSQKYNCVFAGGQEHLAGKIIRFSHLGFFQMGEIIAAMGALEMTFKDFGYNLNESPTKLLIKNLSNKDL